MPTTFTAPASMPESVTSAIDADLETLRSGVATWAALSISQRIRLLTGLRESIAREAETWARAAARSKSLDDRHPLRGEEWLTGPYATLVAIDAYVGTLRSLRIGASPLDKLRVDRAWGGRVRVHAFPAEPADHILLSGFSGEIWLQPSVDEATARRRVGLGQLRPGERGGVGLVLGAGNVTSIPVLDVLYELLAFNRVSVLKLNPTQDTLAPVFERALAPLIGLGLLRIVRGGGDVGAYLTTHPEIEHVHITGAAATFNTIVWGSPAGPGRRRNPVLKTPITAELGGVSPIIVVPGEWTDEDLRFQAEHVVTMRLQNSGHNCIAGQVLILSADWPQRERFLDEVEAALARAPRRPVWYPRADEKLRAAASDYPAARWIADGTRALIELEPDADATALENTEYFAPVLGAVALPGTGQAFLDAAVEHANDALTGTLGANILVDPETERDLGLGLERAIAQLRYGTIAVNAWTGIGFASPTLPWGAFPGADLREVHSGLGVVHNGYLLDDIERAVVRGPFRPLPRSLGALVGPGRFSILPRPPWFVTSRTGADVSRLLTQFRIRPRLSTLAALLARALGS